MDSKEKKFIGALGTIMFGGLLFAALVMEPAPPKPTSASDAAATAWAIDQLDPNHTIEKAQIQNCMATAGCDITAPSAPPASPPIPSSKNAGPGDPGYAAAMGESGAVPNSEDAQRMPDTGQNRQDSSSSLAIEDKQAEQQEYVKKAQWRTVQADNGMRYMVDISSVHRLTNGNVTINFVSVETNAPTASINPMDVEQFIFDCQGNYQVIAGSGGPTEFAPYDSVSGRIGAFACKSALKP